MSLRLYPVTLQMLRDVADVLPQIRREDPNLADQMRRAATSCSLNLSEGMYSRGRNRDVRYHTSMGSAREVLGCWEAAVALRYVDAIDDAAEDRLRKIIGTLVRLLRPHG